MAEILGVTSFFYEPKSSQPIVGSTKSPEDTPLPRNKLTLGTHCQGIDLQPI
jgi:hypothetical protein